ncbi:hypothetical protein DQ04_06141020 [Trypanosoma grayi]|uniref:hypothetical protein n=1 Tax=Trypanosoma grayi TaxID=71804 RepID=UPI0004F4A13F|nr:hypothetical protein DQ04_06141020 [Trypanosoma grayi]KEG08939.1 hypothetical protein DQ04_06141020 [Trypanosoma grayi]
MRRVVWVLAAGLCCAALCVTCSVTAEGSAGAVEASATRSSLQSQQPGAATGGVVVTHGATRRFATLTVQRANAVLVGIRVTAPLPPDGALVEAPATLRAQAEEAEKKAADALAAAAAAVKLADDVTVDVKLAVADVNTTSQEAQRTQREADAARMDADAKKKLAEDAQKRYDELGVVVKGAEATVTEAEKVAEAALHAWVEANSEKSTSAVALLKGWREDANEDNAWETTANAVRLASSKWGDAHAALANLSTAKASAAAAQKAAQEAKQLAEAAKKEATEAEVKADNKAKEAADAVERAEAARTAAVQAVAAMSTATEAAHSAQEKAQDAVREAASAAARAEEARRQSAHSSDGVDATAVPDSTRSMSTVPGEKGKSDGSGGGEWVRAPAVLLLCVLGCVLLC